MIKQIDRMKQIDFILSETLHSYIIYVMDKPFDVHIFKPRYRLGIYCQLNTFRIPFNDCHHSYP
jgi:hypothetical protein